MKYRYYFAIILMLLSSFKSFVFSQDNCISIILTDKNREDRKIRSEIYLPEKDTIYHIMIIAHGFVMNADAYSNLAKYYQKKNFIVFVLNTETSLNADQLEFANDISFVRKWIEKQSANSSSVFYNKYSGFSVAVGHSMGGGAAVIAGSLDPELDLIVGLAPAAQTGIANSKARKVLQPVLFITSIEDVVTPINDFALPLFDNIASQNKTMVKLKKGYHCYFADPNFWCDIAESLVSRRVDIKRNEQQETTIHIIDLWINEIRRNNSEFSEKFFKSIKDNKWSIVSNMQTKTINNDNI